MKTLVLTLGIMFATSAQAVDFRWPQTLAGLSAEQQEVLQREIPRPLELAKFRLVNYRPTVGEAGILMYAKPGFDTDYVLLYVDGATINRATTFTRYGGQSQSDD